MEPNQNTLQKKYFKYVLYFVTQDKKYVLYIYHIGCELYHVTKAMSLIKMYIELMTMTMASFA